MGVEEAVGALVLRILLVEEDVISILDMEVVDGREEVKLDIIIFEVEALAVVDGRGGGGGSMEVEGNGKDEVLIIIEVVGRMLEDI